MKLTSVLGLSVCALAYAVPIEKRAADIELPAKRDDSTPVPPGGEIVTFTPSDDGPLVDIAGLGPERENPDMIAEFSGTDLPAKRDDSTPVPPGGKTVTFTPSGNSPVVELTGLGPQKEQPGIFAGVPGTDLPVQTKPDGVDVLAYDEPSH